MHEEFVAKETPESAEEALPLVRRPVYEVHIEAFEGPLDLLLHLIREHEHEIRPLTLNWLGRVHCRRVHGGAGKPGER